jgi:hypothetical protein
MEAFAMEIAGLTARILPLFSSTREYCRPYLSEGEAEVLITISEQDLDYEQKMLKKEALEEGLRVRHFPDPFLERATVQRKFARALLERNTLLLHGSTGGVDGQAYLFTAPCRTGKSTHTRLWREVFGSRAVMVNDDKAFLRITDSGVLAFGSPWTGKHGLGSNICLPLRGICFLSRGGMNRIVPAEPVDCIEALLHQSFLPDDAAGVEKTAALAKALSQKVALWQMQCTKDPEAAHTSYEAMSGHG